MEESTSSPYQSVQGGMLYFRPVTMDDLERIYALEVAGYPEDEAASREKMQFRMEAAPQAFLVAIMHTAEGEDELVGYTCGTCTRAGKLTHESMGAHDADGSLLCIHSVCVDAKYRRQKVATRMLKAYLAYVQSSCPHVTSLRLLCKKEMVKLYEGAGFSLLGPSDVVHGAEQWLDMELQLQQPAAAAAAAAAVAAAVSAA